MIPVPMTTRRPQLCILLLGPGTLTCRNCASKVSRSRSIYCNDYEQVHVIQGQALHGPGSAIFGAAERGDMDIFLLALKLFWQHVPARYVRALSPSTSRGNHQLELHVAPL
jgi:hypothetical protein